MTNLSTSASVALIGHRRLVCARVLWLLLLGAVALASFLADVSTGPSSLTVYDVVHALLRPHEVSAGTRVIIWDVRLAQAFLALLVGMALSLAGAEMQTVLNNPLASPFTLGMSSSATFGAALAIVLGIGLPGVSPNWIISVNAFVFAFGSTLLLQWLARLRGTGGETVVLFGIALFFTFNALVAIMQFIANEQALQQLVFWTLGSLTRADSGKNLILTIVLAAVLPWSLVSSWKLTALRLGEARARSFGIDVARLRFVSLMRASLLTGAAVAFAGTIAFIGLVGPHIARLLVGEDHRFFLPASALAGCAVMSLASCASKLVVTGMVLPIGLVTSLIGVPFFLVLILARRERH